MKRVTALAPWVVALAWSWAMLPAAQADDDSALRSWQAAVGKLHEAREHGETCASVLKAYGEEQEVAEGRLLYSSARGGFNAYIEEMLFLLDAGEGLESDLESSIDLDHAAVSLDELCTIARAALPQGEGNKSLVLDIFKAIGGDVVQVIGSGTTELIKAWAESNRLQQQLLIQRIEGQRWVRFEEVESAL